MSILFENQTITKKMKYHLIYLLGNYDNKFIKHNQTLIKISLRKIIFFGIILGKLKKVFTVPDRYT